MAAELVTPVDEISGLPLPIAPNDLLDGGLSVFRDYHHHFHPRNHELLQGTGRAVRYSRGQLLPRALHDRYHQIFVGPPLPENDADRYKLSVLACAGVVPRQAIDLGTPGEYKIIDLSNNDYARLASPNSVYIERAHKFRKDMYVRRAIGRFFAHYALQQDVRLVVSNKVIKEFLHDKTSPERKKELGNFILKEALGMSVDDIVPIHQEIRREGLVLPGREAPLLNIVRRFFTKEHFPDYHQPMGETLRSLVEFS